MFQVEKNQVEVLKINEKLLNKELFYTTSASIWFVLTIRAAMRLIFGMIGSYSNIILDWFAMGLTGLFFLLTWVGDTYISKEKTESPL